MGELVSFGMIILAAAVHASLQLGLGGLLLLYHESKGKHVNNKTRGLVGSYISGVGVIVFLLLATACYIVTTLFGGILSVELLAAIMSILLVLSLVMWVFYYRRGETMELWLPKAVSRFIDGRAKVTNSNTEAFSLGVLTSFAELPFTIVLLLVAGNSILELETIYQPLMVAIYTIIAIVPLVVFRLAIRSGRNVVDVQKWRVRNKMFLRIVSGAGFLVLAIFVFAFKVMGAV